MGVVDLVRAEGEQTFKTNKIAPICLPEGIPGDTITQIVARYLDQNPDPFRQLTLVPARPQAQYCVRLGTPILPVRKRPLDGSEYLTHSPLARPFLQKRGALAVDFPPIPAGFVR
jgi:hypothetical protein